jgi:hypothetical protein
VRYSRINLNSKRERERERAAVLVTNEALDLMELTEVSSVHGLVTENSVDAEVFGGLPAFLRDSH